MDILTEEKIISTFQLEALISTLHWGVTLIGWKEGKKHSVMVKFDLLLQTIVNTLTIAEAIMELR